MSSARVSACAASSWITNQSGAGCVRSSSARAWGCAAGQIPVTLVRTDLIVGAESTRDALPRPNRAKAQHPSLLLRFLCREQTGERDAGGGFLGHLLGRPRAAADFRAFEQDI